MNRSHANKLLDAVRAGRKDSRISHVSIRKALQVTGDLPQKIVMPNARRMPNFGRTV